MQKGFSGILVIMVAALALSACVIKRVNLVDAQTVQVEKVDSKEAYIDSVNVHQHEQEMEIEVVIRTSEPVRQFIAGFVDISIAGPGDKDDIMSFRISNPVRGGHYHGVSDLHHAHFWVRFPYTAKTGTVVRVQHIPRP